MSNCNKRKYTDEKEEVEIPVVYDQDILDLTIDDLYLEALRETDMAVSLQLLEKAIERHASLDDKMSKTKLKCFVILGEKTRACHFWDEAVQLFGLLESKDLATAEDYLYVAKALLEKACFNLRKEEFDSKEEKDVNRSLELMGRYLKSHKADENTILAFLTTFAELLTSDLVNPPDEWIQVAIYFLSLCTEKDDLFYELDGLFQLRKSQGTDKNILLHALESFRLIKEPKIYPLQLMAETLITLSAVEIEDDESSLQYYDEAIYCYQKVLEIDPENDQVTQILECLNSSE